MHVQMRNSSWLAHKYVVIVCQREQLLKVQTLLTHQLQKVLCRRPQIAHTAGCCHTAALKICLYAKLQNMVYTASSSMNGEYPQLGIAKQQTSWLDAEI